MSPPLDLDSLRRQYPDLPGWGERVFLEMHALRAALSAQTRLLIIVAGAAAGAVPALQAAGLI